MKLEAIREEHLQQLYERLAPDAETLGSVYMEILLEQYEWFYDAYMENIVTPTGTRYYVITNDNSVIGLIELSDHDTIVKVGYWLYKPYRKQGIMTSNLGKLLSTVTKTVVISIQPHNTASKKIAERLGYTINKTDETLQYYVKH